MQQFDSAEDCREALRRHLTPGDRSPNQEILIDVLVADCREPGAGAEESASESAFSLRLGKWIVRDTDLQLYDALASAMIGLFATNLVLRELSAASVAALILGTLKILRAAHQSGTWLTDRQVEVVLMLEAHRGTPIGVESLVSLMNADNDSEKWDARSLTAELEEMRELATKQGFVAVVECNGENEWLLGDV